MRKILVLFSLGALIFVGQGGVAHAGPVGVTALVEAGNIGLRSLTLTSPISLVSVADSDVVSGLMVIEVTEAAVTGTDPWSVTATMTDLTKGADTITNDNLSIVGASTSRGITGGGTIANGADGAFSDTPATRTVYTVNGQNEAVAYTGLYATNAPLQLEIPNGTVTGSYSGTMTITLQQ